MLYSWEVPALLNWFVVWNPQILEAWGKKESALFSFGPAQCKRQKQCGKGWIAAAAVGFFIPKVMLPKKIDRRKWYILCSPCTGV